MPVDELVTQRWVLASAAALVECCEQQQRRQQANKRISRGPWISHMDLKFRSIALYANSSRTEMWDSDNIAQIKIL
jgi:hypothetical protein